MGVVVSSSHGGSAAPTTSEGGHLTCFPFSSTGSLSWRQSSMNFSNVDPSHSVKFFTMPQA